jgi:acetyl-CoA C-acetyltransferase
MTRTVIVASCRTPVGKFQGCLAGLPAVQLGALAARELLRRAAVEAAAVDEVIIGNVLSSGLGQAPARQVALRAGLPPTVAAVTINKVCGSGLKAVMLADQVIRAGDARVVLAGGIESMSRAPHLLLDARAGWRLGSQTVHDALVHDGLWCSFENWHMGSAGDYVARKYGVSRADQDAYAAESHRRAVAARLAGTFRDEIVTIAAPDGHDQVADDEGPRHDCTVERLSKLAPAFGPDGSVTAGNASMLSDGAAVVLVASEEQARAWRTQGSATGPAARIVAACTAGVEPKELFTAPVKAVRQVLDKAGLRIDEIDLFEINEAFAAQMLACIRQLGLDPQRVNGQGGAIALGHPIGASGARLLVTLLHALARQSKRFGLASLCLGGGNAVAMIIERF